MGHAECTRRLHRMFSEQEPVIPADAILRDDQCDLGGWMYGEGQQYAGCPSFAPAFAAHVVFHRRAGDIISALAQGDRQRAEALLRPGAAFDRATVALAWPLRRLASEMQPVATTG